MQFSKGTKRSDRDAGMFLTTAHYACVVFNVNHTSQKTNLTGHAADIPHIVINISVKTVIHFFPASEPSLHDKL